MKNKTLTLLAIASLLLTSNNIFAQNDCSEASAISTLDINNVRTSMRNGGDFWWDGNNGQYFFPNDQEVSALFAGSIWVSGFDEGGSIKTAAKTYGNGGFWPGLLTENGTIETESCTNWDRMFKIHGDKIDDHQADWADNGQIDGTVDPEILGWPARGNPHFFDIYGFNLPSSFQGLAPFFDENANGIYEPMSGDYPNVNCADQAIWWVFNDVGGINELNTAPLRMEFQVLAYAYQTDPNNTAIGNSTFYEVKMINRGIETLLDTHIGLWIDPDLGCHTDDYVGCIPEENLAFIYNQDAQDGTNGCACDLGIPTFCEEIPVVGIKLLEGPINENGEELGLSSFMAYNNSIVGGAPPGQSNPTTAVEYHNLLSGKWTDGSPVIDFEGETTTYMFPGNPGAMDDNDWTMCDNDMLSGDRRILMSYGPFVLYPGSVNRLRFAVVVDPNVAHPCPDISGLINATENIDNYCNLSPTNTTNTATIEKNAANISLSPNPFSDKTILRLHRSDDLLEVCRIYSLDGKLIRTYESIDAEQLEINKSTLNAGMYLYKLQTQKGTLTSGKLMIL